MTRAKDNLSFKVEQRLQKGAVGPTPRDDLVRLKTPAPGKDYPELMRRICQ